MTAALRAKRLRRRVRQREKRHRRRGGARHWKSARPRRLPLFVRVPFPTEIALKHSESRRLVLNACKTIREAYIQEKQDIILDFSRTKKIYSEGMLWIVAELDRAMRLGGSEQIVRCKMPEGSAEPARIVREVLDQIGLLERIGQPVVGRRGDDERHESVRHWRYATGTRVDEEPGGVLEQHEGRISSGLMQSMQIGLAEALINSLHHAYAGDRKDGCPRLKERRWWMFTHERDGMLSVLVCDLGIGIPRSLPLRWDRALLKKWAAFLPGDPPHVTAIRMALMLGKSSTGEENRGKGLPQIWNATRASDAGHVGILSGRAHVGYDPAEKADERTEFETNLQGTLIAWTFPMVEAVTDG